MIRRGVPLMAVVCLVAGACSGSDTSDTSAVSDTSDAGAATEGTTSPAGPGTTTPDASTAPENAPDTAPVDPAAPTTGSSTADDAAADGSGDAEEGGSNGRPLVINGPATVEGDDDVEDAAAGACAGLPRGVTDIVVEGGGAVHDVRVFVPETLESEPAPLVLDWHGLGSNGPDQAAYSGYETVAAEEGFVTVHPTGALVGGRTSWELEQLDDPGRDDLAFFDVLVDTLVADWCVDESRVYSTGLSNGGFFTAQLVCRRADRLAAAVSVAGVSHAEGCDPSRPVPFQAFHGTEDVVVPFDGGFSVLEGDSTLSNGFFDQVMPEEFAEFAVDFGCADEPERTEVTAEVVRYDYVGCDDDVPVTFFELPGGGHTWPGSPLADTDGAALGFTTDDVDASREGWAFMEQFTL